MSTIQISALPAASGVTADDLLPIEHDPSGTPVTQKATAAQVATTVQGVAGAYVATNIVPSGASSLPINASQADVDVRIKGDTDAALVFLDAGTNRVGIGTATPTTLLDVNGTLKATTFTGSGASITGLAGIAQKFQSLASDPASPTNGDVWYNTTSGTFKGRRAGASQTFAATTYMAATGGTITTIGDYKIHTFLTSGTFTVTDAGLYNSTSNLVEYLVVAGGGGASGGWGGTGGGGFRTANGLNVTAIAYTITVGAGGTASANGGSSTFSTITSAGGGGETTQTGGSGAGAQVYNGGVGYAGNTPSTSPVQGYRGGSGSSYLTGGGGGGGASIGLGSYEDYGITIYGGAGGDGAYSNIDGLAYLYSGGGGGGAYDSSATAACSGGTGGAGAGGGLALNGATNTQGSYTDGARNAPSAGNGGANTGGGAGGAVGISGGSGIVILRYRYQ